jgi:hypothetical protein
MRSATLGRRYWRSLIGAARPPATPQPRARNGYGFGRRYIASLLGVTLPPRVAPQTDAVPESIHMAGREDIRDSAPAIRTPAAATRMAIQEALERLRLTRFGPGDPVAHLTTSSLELFAQATSTEPNRFQVELRFLPKDLSLDFIGAGITLTSANAEEEGTERHLTVVDTAQRAVLRNIPVADWTFGAVERTSSEPDGGLMYPLPKLGPDEYELAAAHGTYSVVLPSRVIYLVDRPDPDGAYRLEIIGSTGGLGPVLVRYEDTDSIRRSLLVPVMAAQHGRPRSRVWLPGFSARVSWETGEAISPASLGVRDRQLIAESIAAAADRNTQRAWRLLVDDVQPAIADVILTLLGGGQQPDEGT